AQCAGTALRGELRSDQNEGQPATGATELHAGDGAQPVRDPHPECQAVSDLCQEWRSVAEISALCRIPLGVARVLVADMAEQGLVQIRSSLNTDSRPNVNLLERVLSGLRKL